MLFQDRLGNPAQQCPDADGEDENVVDLTEQRDPVWNHVERHRQVAGDRDEAATNQSWHAVVPDNPPQQTEDVRESEDQIARR